MFARKSICLAVACAAVSTSNVYAKNQLEHIIVSGVLHKTQAETALPVTVVSGEELRNLSTNSIGDTLGSMPGIANASFGPSVGQPVIRGQQGPRVSVLQNGTGSGDASNNSADHAVSVEPVLAESVEVLRGPSTLLYGG
ncbi:MAG: Plug domain-containing protein, partial [Sinobacterium sp.]